MCTLYLFNFNNEMTLKEIKENSGFDEETAEKNKHLYLITTFLYNNQNTLVDL